MACFWLRCDARRKRASERGRERSRSAARRSAANARAFYDWRTRERCWLIVSETPNLRAGLGGGGEAPARTLWCGCEITNFARARARTCVRAAAAFASAARFAQEGSTWRMRCWHCSDAFWRRRRRRWWSAAAGRRRRERSSCSQSHAASSQDDSTSPPTNRAGSPPGRSGSESLDVSGLRARVVTTLPVLLPWRRRRQSL